MTTKNLLNQIVRNYSGMAIDVGTYTLPQTSFQLSTNYPPLFNTTPALAQDYSKMGLPNLQLGFDIPIFNANLMYNTSTALSYDTEKMTNAVNWCFEESKKAHEKYLNLYVSLPTQRQNPTQTDTNHISDYNCSSEKLKAKWSAKKPHLTDNFYKKVIKISKRIGCAPDDLMLVMQAESGIKANNPNKTTNAQGLIQFMPTVAKELGTSTESLSKMSEEEQLDYVEKYLKRWKKSAGFKTNEKIDLGTLYALVYTPAYAKSDTLTSKFTNNDEKLRFYNQNKPLDMNKDGYITKNDLVARVYSLA